MRFFLFVVYISFFFHAVVVDAYAKTAPKAEKKPKIEEKQQKAKKQPAKKKPSKENVLKKLGHFSHSKVLPNFDFLFGFSVGISAFYPKELTDDIKNWSRQLTDDSNALFLDKNPYQTYKQKNVPPFSFELDFRFFHKWYGAGISYQRFFITSADYRIGRKNNEIFRAIYKNPLAIKYKMYSDGFYIGPWFRQNIYTQQVQFLGSLGYSYSYTRLDLNFEGGETLKSKSQSYKVHTHGVYAKTELMVFYKNFTYGLGVLFEWRDYRRFVNENGTLIGQNGKSISINSLKIPVFYLRFGVSF